MFTPFRITRGTLIAGALFTTLSLGTTLAADTTAGAHREAVALAAAALAAAQSALTAEEAIDIVTHADGVIRFDIAEDGKRFVWADAPVFDDGLPAHGATYISQGYIYPTGTLTDEIDGVNADGSPEFPEKVLGQWSCYGWYVGDGAHATEGPWVLSTQYYTFGSEWGEASLVSEGYVLSESGGTVMRAITGGTGPFAAMRGEMADTTLGFNETEGGNARHEVTLAS